jgi:hypothetical protein
MGGGKGSTVGDVDFGYTRNADAGLPRVVSRTWADIANSFDGLKGAGPIDEVL